MGLDRTIFMPFFNTNRLTGDSQRRRLTGFPKAAPIAFLALLNNPAKLALALNLIYLPEWKIIPLGKTIRIQQ